MAHALTEEEHHFGDGGLERDVVARKHTCGREDVAGDITIGVYASVDTLSDVENYDAATDSIGHCVDKPFGSGTIAGAVSAEHHTFYAWGREQVGERLLAEPRK